MINHYINLVCWRSMLTLFKPERDLVWVDTVSLLGLVNRLRNDVVYRPGTTVLSDIGPGKGDAGEWYFLTAKPLNHVPADKQFALPMLDEIVISTELEQVDSALAPQTKVGIGISSPKQNFLAAALHEVRPDLDYYCLGAALAGLDEGEGSASKSVLSGTGIEWLRFLFHSCLLYTSPSPRDS